jgi:hypothetical protein
VLRRCCYLLTASSDRLHLPEDGVVWDVVRGFTMTRLGIENKVTR